MHFQYPHLTMSQIHSALAYYWDFKAEMDADIQRILFHNNAKSPEKAVKLLD